MEMNNTDSNYTENKANVMSEAAIKEKYLKAHKSKLKTAKLITAAMIIISLFLSLFVFKTPEPSKQWVYDKDGELSNSTINIINGKNRSLYDQTGTVEVVVVVEKESGSNKDLIKRSEKLFKEYKVSDEGVLFVMVVPKKTDKNAIGEFFENLFGTGKDAYACVKGRNAPDSLTDSKISGIIAGSGFSEYYSKGQYNAAVLSAFNDLMYYFEQYYNITVSNDTPPETTAAASSVNYSLTFLVVIILILLLVVIFTKKRKDDKIRRVYKNPSWFGPDLN